MKGALPPGGRGLAVGVRSGAGRTPSSRRWLERQLNDPYVRAAQADGWRSRAAFKLVELDEKYGLIPRGGRVLDLGAAPGGWTQAALRRGAGAVVGIDLLAIVPLPGAIFVQGDFNDPEMPARLTALLGGRADLVLSDLAPNTTGHTATDNIRITLLAELALDLAFAITNPGGAFVAKLFQGGAERGMLERMKRGFAQVRHAKPPASRKESRELYVVATGFRGDA